MFHGKCQPRYYQERRGDGSRVRSWVRFFQKKEKEESRNETEERKEAKQKRTHNLQRVGDFCPVLTRHGLG